MKYSILELKEMKSLLEVKLVKAKLDYRNLEGEDIRIEHVYARSDIDNKNERLSQYKKEFEKVSKIKHDLMIAIEKIDMLFDEAVSDFIREEVLIK